MEETLEFTQVTQKESPYRASRRSHANPLNEDSREENDLINQI